MDRPKMTQSVQHTAMKDGDLSALDELLLRSTRGRFRVPLYCDHMTLAAPCLAGDQTLNVASTQFRRVFVDSLVAVCRKEGIRWKYEIAAVQDLTTTGLTLKAPLQSDYTAGCRVFPLVECDLSLNTGSKAISDKITTSNVVFQQVVGKAALPSVCDENTIPEGVASINGLPVLSSLPHDWQGVSLSALRGGQLVSLGRGQVFDDLRENTRWGIALSFSCLSRQAAWRVISFFDSRRGRKLPFWVVSPTSDAALVRIESDGISIKRTNTSINLLRARKHICLRRWDGSMEVRKIVSIVEGPVEIRLVFDTPYLEDASSVRRVSWAFLCRFGSDEMTESWLTDKIMTTGFECQEVLEDNYGERLPSAPDIVDPSSSEPSLPPWVPDLDCYETSGQILTMYSVPCVTCDPYRPAMLARALEMPKRLKVTFKNQYIGITTNAMKSTLAVISGVDLQANNNLRKLQAIQQRLGQSWFLEYDATYGVQVSVSRHPHHIRLTDLPLTWDMPNGGVACTKRRWKATTNVGYVERTVSQVVTRDEGGSHTETRVTETPMTLTLEIYLQSETPTSPVEGCHGTVFHLYVFCPDLFGPYTDGASVTCPIGTLTFTKDDPVVAVPETTTTNLRDGRAFHPHLILHGYIPTSMEAPCGSAWGFPHETMPVLRPGLPDSYGGAGYYESAKDNSVFRKFDETAWAAITLGADCESSTILNYLCVEPSMGRLPLYITEYDRHGFKGPGEVQYTGMTTTYVPANLRGLTYRSAIDLEACSVEDGETECCGTINCWKADPLTMAGKECCFSATAPLRLTLNQYCLANLALYDETATETSRQVSGRLITFQHLLMPRRCRYYPNTPGDTEMYFEWYARFPSNTIPGDYEELVIRYDENGWSMPNEVPHFALPVNATNTPCQSTPETQCSDPGDPAYHVSVGCEESPQIYPDGKDPVGEGTSGFVCGPEGANPLADPGTEPGWPDFPSIQATVDQCGSTGDVCCEGFSFFVRPGYLKV